MMCRVRAAYQRDKAQIQAICTEIGKALQEEVKDIAQDAFKEAGFNLRASLSNLNEWKAGCLKTIKTIHDQAIEAKKEKDLKALYRFRVKTKEALDHISRIMDGPYLQDDFLGRGIRSCKGAPMMVDARGRPLVSLPKGPAKARNEVIKDWNERYRDSHTTIILGGTKIKSSLE